jgi:hypothetical protein
MSSCEAFRPLLILFIFGQIIKAMMVTLGIDPQWQLQRNTLRHMGMKET